MKDTTTAATQNVTIEVKRPKASTLEQFSKKYEDTQVTFDSWISFKVAGKRHEVEYGKTTMLSFIDWMSISEERIWYITNGYNFNFITHDLITALNAILHFNKVEKGGELYICSHKNWAAALNDFKEQAEEMDNL